MSLVPVAQVSDLSFLDGTDDEILAALSWASSAVESYCEREFAQVVDDVINVDPQYTSRSSASPFPGFTSGYSSAYSSWQPGSGGASGYGGAAMLPNPPVTGVRKIEALLPISDALAWTELTAFAWSSDGLIWDTAGMPAGSGGNNAAPSWPTTPRSLRVTYTHGYVLPGQSGSNLPQGIVDAVIRAAAYYLANPVNAVDVKVGDVSTRFQSVIASPSISGILDSTLLAKYRLVSL